MNLKSAIKYTAVAVIAGMPVACDDDPFGKNSGFSSDVPVFNAELSSSWHSGMPTSRSRSVEIRIDEAETTLSDGTQLYLVTEKHVLDSCKADADPKARGAQINSMDLFPASFGLSAFCHTGNIADYGKDEIVSNFVGNVAIKKDGYPVDNNDNLNWPGKGSNVTFYAYAPFADGVNGVQAVSGKPELTLTVNKNIKDQIDLLTAVSKDCSGDGSDGKVDLKFGHALSAVTFVAGDAMMAGTIKKITLSGVYATGGTVIGSATWTSLSNVSEFTTGDISLDVENGGDYYNVYSDKGTQITGGDENLTMFMIPQTLPAGARIKIDFVDALSVSSHTIEADISGFKWEPGKLYKYSLSTSGITVTPVVEILDYKKTPKTYPDKDDAYKIKKSEVVVPYSGVLDDVKLKAYLRIARAGQTGESVVGSSFTVEASTDGGTTWVDGKGDAAANTCRWIADVAATVSRAAGSEVTGTLLLPAQSAFSRLSTWTESGNGTKDVPVDLSGGGETANCYRITDHGYYKIPLYYGNSRNSSGGENTSAYTMTNMESDGFLFYPDHMGNAITKGKISEQLSGKVSLKDALLLWQDAPGLVDDVALDGDFITFRVGKYALTQGNALIALRDDKGDIVWSWHIWSTDSKWENNLKYTTSKIGSGKPYKLTSTNLGYCDPHGGNDARDIKLKFVFDYKDASGKSYEYVYPDAFRQDELIASTAGDNTYYQWGRKDPMLPGIYTNTSKTYDSDDAPTNDKTIHYYPVAGWADKGEMSMINKPFFDSPEEYGFKSIIKGAKTAEGEGISVVDAIKNPHCHVIGLNSKYHRTHWHNGKGESYVSEGESVHRMSHAWNSSGGFEGKQEELVAGNDVDVVKTIYDPSPAGYHVPSVGAYTGLADAGGGTKAAVYSDNIPTFDGVKWTLKCENGSIEFPATGMRDTDVRDNDEYAATYLNPTLVGLRPYSWAGFQFASYIASATGVFEKPAAGVLDISTSCQVLLLILDNRVAGSGSTDLYKHRLASCVRSYNAYGLSVRPVADN